MTSFYSPRTISYVAEKYRLPLLYDIYLGKLTKEEAKHTIGITYCRIKTLCSLLGIKSSGTIIMDVIRYSDYFFISKTKWISPDKNQFEILLELENVPSDHTLWSNSHTKIIVRQLLLFKNIEDILNKNS